MQFHQYEMQSNASKRPLFSSLLPLSLFVIRWSNRAKKKNNREKNACCFSLNILTFTHAHTTCIIRTRTHTTLKLRLFYDTQTHMHRGKKNFLTLNMADELKRKK